MEKLKLSVLTGLGVAAVITLFEATLMLIGGRNASGSLVGFLLTLALPVAAGLFMTGRFKFKAGAEIGIFVVLLSLGLIGYVQLIPNMFARGVVFFLIYSAAFALGSHLLEVRILTLKRKWVIFSSLFVVVVSLQIGVNFATRLVFSNAS
ncbi:hypothetical protein OHT57_34020 [Streptomyces sp. NBC_00285]|uniref:hypothetical protein n=1 Tax=Streptomyces sp. NBC_00285 TaxID=2975700 RepID=UPI002E286EB5|nr:hypothetical protein [Streptomyces sp. NBC_00285]